MLPTPPPRTLLSRQHSSPGKTLAGFQFPSELEARGRPHRPSGLLPHPRGMSTGVKLCESEDDEAPGPSEVAEAAAVQAQLTAAWAAKDRKGHVLTQQPRLRLQCNRCRCICDGKRCEAFGCRDCDFDLCPRCHRELSVALYLRALATQAREAAACVQSCVVVRASVVDPHGHALTPQHGVPRECDRCHAVCDGLNKIPHGCRLCDFDLCGRCVAVVRAPAPADSEGHTLVPCRRRKRQCDECRVICDGRRDIAVSCAACDYDLCPTCADAQAVVRANYGWAHAIAASGNVPTCLKDYPQFHNRSRPAAAEDDASPEDLLAAASAEAASVDLLDLDWTLRPMVTETDLLAGEDVAITGFAQARAQAATLAGPRTSVKKARGEFEFTDDDDDDTVPNPYAAPGVSSKAASPKKQKHARTGGPLLGGDERMAAELLCDAARQQREDDAEWQRRREVAKLYRERALQGLEATTGKARLVTPLHDFSSLFAPDGASTAAPTFDLDEAMDTTFDEFDAILAERYGV